MCFVCISEHAAIISVFNIKWPVFITKRVGVYCAVRTESVNILVLFSASKEVKRELFYMLQSGSLIVKKRRYFLTFICLRETTLSYDVAYRTVRS
jgi:hypothetical protein